jgi:HEAT repeat protein
MRVDIRVTSHPTVRTDPTDPVYDRAAENEGELVSRLSAELEAEIGRYRKVRLRALLGKVFRFGLILALVWFLFNRNWSNLWWMMIVFGGSKATDEHARRRREAASALSRISDKRAVNVLAIAYASGDESTRKVAGEGLVRLLPLLAASDAGLVDDRGMAALIGMLNRRNINAPLVVAVLKALQQVGDGRAVQAVERMRTMPRPVNFIAARADRWFRAGMAAELRKVTDAAEECLPYLRIRAEQQRLRETLLRPSERPATERDLLLRPLMTAAPGNDELLLRPTGQADG